MRLTKDRLRKIVREELLREAEEMGPDWEPVPPEELHGALSGAIWDLYKYVHGVRPRHLDFKSMEVPELEKMWIDLNQQLEDQEAAEAEYEAEQAERAELERMKVPEPGSHLPLRTGMGKRPPEKNVKVESRKLREQDEEKKNLHLSFDQRHLLSQKVYNAIIRYLKEEKLGISKEKAVEFEQAILKLIEVVDKNLV